MTIEEALALLEAHPARIGALTHSQPRARLHVPPLPRTGWARRATVTGSGRPLERTVLHYAERLAAHERSHVQQIERIVGRSEGA